MASITVSVNAVTGQTDPSTWTVEVGDNKVTNAKPTVDLSESKEYEFKLTELPDGYVRPTTPLKVVVDKNGDASPNPAVFTVAVKPTCVVDVKVKGPDDAPDVNEWTVEAKGGAGEVLKVTGGAAGQKLTIGTAGNYELAVTKIADTHLQPGKKQTVVVTADGNGSLKAEPSSIQFIASAAPKATGSLVTVSSAALIVAAMLWIPFVLLLPDPEKRYLWDWLAAVIAGVGVVLFGVGITAFKSSSKSANWLALFGVVVGPIVFLTAAVLSEPVKFSAGSRFAVGVGGLALAAFVIGLTMFESIKGAAALPVVVLFIGSVVWPTFADTPLDADTRKTLFAWSPAYLVSAQ